MYAAPNSQKIRVGFAVMDEAKSAADWKFVLERRLGYASKVFQDEFGVRFEPVIYWDWKPANPRRDMTYLLEDLRASFPLENVDIVIGVSHLDEVRTYLEAKDMDVIGRTLIFAGYVLLRMPAKPLIPIQEEMVLTHELAHLYGAVHTNDRDNIMSPYVDRQIPVKFDPENHLIISKTIKMDFREGREALDPETIQWLMAAYGKLKYDQQPLEFYYALGVFYLKVGQHDEAITSWKRAVQIEPAHAQVRYDLGMLYYKLGALDQAVRELVEAARLLDLPTQKERRIEALLALGAAYYKKEDWQSAYRSWSQVEQLEPGNPEAEFNLAVLEMKRGNLDRAIESFKKIGSRDGFSAELLNNLGAAYFRKNDYENAVRFLQQALQSNYSSQRTNGPAVVGESQPWQIHEHLAFSYLNLGNYEKALQHFQNVCEKNDTESCRRQLGEIYFKMGKWNECVQTLKPFIARGTQEAEVYGMVGTSLSEMGRDPEAMDLFRRGISAARDRKLEAKFHMNIGNLLYHQGKWNEAATELRKAVSQDWSNADSHYGLARIYIRTGKFHDARQELKSVLQIQPGRRDAESLLQKVESELR